MATHPDALIKKTFGQVQQHRLVGDINRRFSENRSDVYELALEGLDFDQPIRILDIGCAYGRFTSHLRRRVNLFFDKAIYYITLGYEEAGEN